MRYCVIGGANADIVATTHKPFVPGDSNPGKVRLMAGGVARNIAHNLALLGNEVVFLTVFGGDSLGQFTADSCRKANIDISLCDTATDDTHSCFLSINNCDGEIVGGVSDMLTVNGITPDWIASKLAQIGPVDALVADANLPVESLAYLIDHAEAPLYIDAVSGAKAPKVKEALAQSTKKTIFTLKCNQLEWKLLYPATGIQRIFVSLGAEGLEVLDNGVITRFASLPCQVMNTTGAGDALMAGIIHAGPQASIEEAARVGLRCAKITVESPDTVNNKLKEQYEQIP